MTKKFLVDIKCTGLTKEQAPGFEKFILDLLTLPAKPGGHLFWQTL